MADFSDRATRVAVPEATGGADFSAQATPIEGGLMDLLVQGITVNTADEIAAAGRAGVQRGLDVLQGRPSQFGDLYWQKLAEEQAAVAQAREKYPVLGSLVEIGGLIHNERVVPTEFQ